MGWMVQIHGSVATLFAIVMIGPVFGGCLSEDSLDTVDPGENYRFTDRDVTETNLSAEGSFLIAEHCIPLCWTGQEELYTTPVDLTEVLPVAVPILLNVTLKHLSQEPADITGWFESEDAWTGETKRLHGQNSLRVATTAYLPDEGAKLHFIVAGDIPNIAVEHEWELTAQAYPLAKSIPSAFPVEFEVPDPAMPPRFASLDDQNVPFLLWGPDDQFLGQFSTEKENATDAIRKTGEGAYVIFGPTTDNRLTIHANPRSHAPPLNVLDVRDTVHDYYDGLLDERVHWQFELERVPLAIALGMRIKENAIIVKTSPEFRLETPTGNQTEEAGYALNGLIATGGGPPGERLTLEAGHPDLVPGEYKASWKSNGYGTEATHIIRDYVR